jgi:hypothetical protein
MKISTHVVTLLLFLSVALFAQTSEKSSSPAKHPRSAKTERCASRDPESAYSFTQPLPHTAAAKEHGYDVDYPAQEGHDPVCVSVSALDVILWYSSQGKPFKVKISNQHGGQNSGSHPFHKKPCPDDYVTGCYSGSARPETVGCVYDVEFPRHAEKKLDPHIRITP